MSRVIRNNSNAHLLSCCIHTNPKANPSKPNPVTHHNHVAAMPQLARARRRRRRSPLIADCSASAPVLPPALPQGISLFFSLTITEMKNEMKFL